MTKEEYQKCKIAAKLYHDKVLECEILRKRLAQKERENRILKDRLNYKTASDIRYSKEDADLLLIFERRHK